MSSTDHRLVYDKRKASKNDLHLWSDLAELTCLFDTDRQLMKSQFKDRMNEADDGIMDSEVPDLYKQAEHSLSSSEIDDARESYVEVIWDHLAFRANSLAEKYPFEVTPGKIILKSGHCFENPSHDFTNYIFLLSCSHLVFFKELKHQLATAFELYVTQASMELFGPQWEVVHTGTSKGVDGIVSLPSKERDKMKRLSGLLGFPLRPGRLKSIKGRSVGDGGVDICAFLPSNDLEQPYAVYLISCKCQDDWHIYKLPSDRLKDYLECFYTPLDAMGIPYMYRNTSGNWYSPPSRGSAYFDRYRLLNIPNACILSLRKSMMDRLLQIFEKETIVY